MTGLLICPTCQQQDKRYILGSIDAKGYMYVERYHGAGGTTIIKLSEHVIISHPTCGFGTVISQTTDTCITYQN